MKKNLLLILAILFTFNTFAQDNEMEIVKPVKFKRYGIKAGLNLSHFHNTHQFDMGANDLFKNTTGFSGGYYMDAIGPSGHYSTQFGVQYSGMGTKADISDLKIRLHYIQVPLIFNVRAGYKFINVFAGGGAYGAGAFMGKSEFTDVSTNEKVTNEEIIGMPGASIEDLKSYSYFDAGMIIGGGLEFVLPNDHAIQLGFHQYSSFINISNSTSTINGTDFYNPGTRNRTFMISISYLVKK